MEWGGFRIEGTKNIFIKLSMRSWKVHRFPIIEKIPDIIKKIFKITNSYKKKRSANDEENESEYPKVEA